MCGPIAFARAVSESWPAAAWAVLAAVAWGWAWRQDRRRWGR